MSNVHVVREQRIGYGERGQESRSDEVYVKVLASFIDQLYGLKGARLHVFMCVALHEAQIMLEAQPALTLSSIQGKIDYSRHPVIEALDFLCEHRFLEELTERGAAGEKQYRVSSFSWYGNARPQPRPQPRPVGAKIAPVQKKYSVVDGTLHSSLSENSLRGQQQQRAEVQKILAAAGVGEPNRTTLSGVALEIAHAWAEWLESAPRNFKNPIGFMVRCLLNDAQCAPPKIAEQKALWLQEAERWGIVNR